MIKLLILADDFTGAMDTGVKLAACGILTKVTMETELEQYAFDGTQVLSICASTRHLSPRDAYEVTCGIVRKARALGIPYLLKKTDSALRGNVGAELSAMLDASGRKRLYFLPALPAMNRVTLEGIHYIDGVPVAKSVFGKDPFEPVTDSYVPDILKKQCDKKVFLVGRSEALPTDEAREGICLCDCASDEDLSSRVQELAGKGELSLLAGCSSLAQMLPSILGFQGGRRSGKDEGADGNRSGKDEGADGSGSRTDPAEELSREKKTQSVPFKGLAVICGSVNDITRAQLERAQAAGVSRISLSVEKLLPDNALKTPEGEELVRTLLDVWKRERAFLADTMPAKGEPCKAENAGRSFGESRKEKLPCGENREKQGDGQALSLEEKRAAIARQLGLLAGKLLEEGLEGPLMIIGGDTLQAFLDAIHCRNLEPVKEVFPGVVAFVVEYKDRRVEVLSKSGGFGEESLLVDLLET